jgi:hypothetical protein
LLILSAFFPFSESRDYDPKGRLPTRKIPTKINKRDEEAAISTDVQVGMQKHKRYEKSMQYDPSKSS